MKRFAFRCPLRHNTIYQRLVHQRLHDFLVPWNEEARWDWAKEDIREEELL